MYFAVHWSIKIHKILCAVNTGTCQLIWRLWVQLPEDASWQLLIHQFLIALLKLMDRHLRVVKNTTNLQQLVERTKVLMVVDENSREVAAVQSETSEPPKLKFKSKNLQHKWLHWPHRRAPSNSYKVSIVSRQATFDDIVPTESENGSVIIVAS